MADCVRTLRKAPSKQAIPRVVMASGFDAITALFKGAFISGEEALFDLVDQGNFARR